MTLLIDLSAEFYDELNRYLRTASLSLFNIRSELHASYRNMFLRKKIHHPEWSNEHMLYNACSYWSNNAGTNPCTTTELLSGLGPAWPWPCHWSDTSPPISRMNLFVRWTLLHTVSEEEESEWRVIQVACNNGRQSFQVKDSPSTLHIGYISMMTDRTRRAMVVPP